MSVIKFDRSELIDMFAASWAHGSAASSDGKRYLQQMADAASRILVANESAYMETYPNDEFEPETHITSNEIKSALIRKTIHTVENGYKTLESVRYNLVANNGRDFASHEVMNDLFYVARGMLRLEKLRRSAAA